ncbi:hypothetical protein BKA80DRAFT_264831 [Phyllosticta citrichinensis]
MATAAGCGDRRAVWVWRQSVDAAAIDGLGLIVAAMTIVARAHVWGRTRAALVTTASSVDPDAASRGTTTAAAVVGWSRIAVKVCRVIRIVIVFVEFDRVALRGALDGEAAVQGPVARMRRRVDEVPCCFFGREDVELVLHVFGEHATVVAPVAV